MAGGVSRPTGTTIYTRGGADTTPVTPTVGERRNEIRTATGRFERPESTQFTKESLAAICEAVGHDIDTDRLPSKAEMRAGILRAIGEREVRSDVDRPFRKAELDAIAAALD